MIWKIIAPILIIWGIVGYFVFASVRDPKSRKEAVAQMLASGPLGWLLFMVLCVPYGIRKLRERKRS